MAGEIVPLVYMTHKTDTKETRIHIVRGKEAIIEPLSRNQIINIMEVCLKALKNET